MLDPEVARPANSPSLGSHLSGQLTDLGYSNLLQKELQSALDLAAQGTIETVIYCCSPPLCAEALLSLSELNAGVGLVLASSEQPDAEQLVRGMQAGALDSWTLPLADVLLSERIDAVVNRLRRTADQFNSEVAGLRAELEKDQRAGQHIQMGMLPPNPMGIGHFRLQHRVKPSLLLSGDFVDYFQITDKHFAFYVADVAGHGASSAFVTVLLKNFSRRLRREYRTSMLEHPGQILSWINAELIDHGIDKHVAMFMGIVNQETQSLRYANAAQFPPAILIVEGKIQSLEQRGKPLGLFPDLEYESRKVQFPAGSRLVAFTDGVLDLIDADSIELKEQRLETSMLTSESMDDLWQCLDQSRIGLDDVSCLLIEHEG